MSSKDPVENLLQKTQDANICMFTTTEDDGSLVSRPMVIQAIDDDHTIWFMTRVNTPAMQEVAGGQQVNVSVAEKGFWASISGVATAVQDIDRKKEFWSKTTEAFFGDAKPEDPEVVLLKVTPETGQYWDSPGLPAMAVELVKGLKGDNEAARPGESREVDL
ncbi:pyridoxamine 5'-phosphate oxidase family protein [Yaniella halotolerans]|uniref:pyridoxamine 5'-phosphate oxidase family protein n=1 Tax=Yaniella halotolerans TaxID=225453 RepID=UPI0003B6B331|nr:pyridoxamine 5'-phosphate oxidase family protein [Yaniella halotolerans]